MRLFLIIGVACMSCVSASAEWGKVQPLQIVFEDAASREHKKSSETQSTWVPEHAKLIAKGRKSYTWILLGGVLRKELRVDPLLKKDDDGAAGSKPVPVPSYLWVAADVIGTVGSHQKPGSLSLGISAPSSDEKGGHISPARGSA